MQLQPDIICRYIHLNGVRCGSPRLRDHVFCYWHKRLNHHHAEAETTLPRFYAPQNDLKNREQNPLLDQYFANTRVNGPTPSELPPLEDPESIQLALSMLVASIASARIDPRTAGLALYGLQIASQNVRHLRPAGDQSIQDVTLDELGREIAAPSPNPEPDPEPAASTQEAA